MSDITFCEKTKMVKRKAGEWLCQTCGVAVIASDKAHATSAHNEQTTNKPPKKNRIKVDLSASKITPQLIKAVDAKVAAQQNI